MAVPIGSRYWGSEVHVAADAAGEPHATVAIRRHNPALGTAYHHVVTGMEDVEYLAWRFYGTGGTWWMIADANPLAFPLDLRPGDRVAIPAAARPAQADRSRRF